MKITFDTDSIASRKWLMLVTLLPAVVFDIILILSYRWFWGFGRYFNYDMEIMEKSHDTITKIVPHIVIIPLMIMPLIGIIVSFILYKILKENNKIECKQTMRIYYLLILLKSIIICLVMYFIWNRDFPAGVMNDSKLFYHLYAEYDVRNILSMIFIPLTYIPIIVLICKNKDRV